jgi:acyl-CoA synthetase (AMP-forming)/AMP-acid ligase II
VPAAAVTLLGPATEEELMQYLAGRLTRYQRPVTIKVVDQLPRTPSLKISRALVREHYFNGFNGFSGAGQQEPDGVAETATTGDVS